MQSFRATGTHTYACQDNRHDMGRACTCAGKFQSQSCNHILHTGLWGTSQVSQRPLQHTNAELCSAEGSVPKLCSASPRSSGRCSAWSARSRTLSSCSPTHAGFYCVACAAQVWEPEASLLEFSTAGNSLGRGLQARRACRGGGWAAAVWLHSQLMGCLPCEQRSACAGARDALLKFGTQRRECPS